VAVLTFDCREKFNLFTSDRGDVRTTSERVGVADLDRRLGDELDAELKERLQRATNAMWDKVRRVVYAGEPGRDERDLPERILARSGEAARHALNTFCDQVGGVVERACVGLPEAQMQEVFLTGGGSHIPAVCRTIEAQINLPGRRPTYVSSPVGSTTLTDAGFRPLNPNVYRGATALGGASIFFDDRN
jgi:hypothetical protein